MAATAIRAHDDFLTVVKKSPLYLEGPMNISEFTAFAERFPDLRMELEIDGQVHIMTPVKKGSGLHESAAVGLLWAWTNINGGGQVFSPSTGIRLPDGSVKSPDCAWVSDEKLVGTSDEEFLNAVPDLIVEIKSMSDSLKKLEAKMEKVWMANGVRLGWLIHPYREKAWIYRESGPTELVRGFVDAILSGEDIMPGFEMPLKHFIAKK